MYTLFTDGGARGNPGPAAIGAFIFRDQELVTFDGKYLGAATNNTAEYEALILGLKLAQKAGIDELLCNLDSELVVKQLNGEYKVRDESISKLFKRVLVELEKFKSVKFQHVRREQNQFADRLVNVILDLKG